MGNGATIAEQDMVRRKSKREINNNKINSSVYKNELLSDESDELKNILENFHQFEKICRSGYFKNNLDNYNIIFREALRQDALDVLEILIVAGNINQIQPLHLACSFGKLESVELLVSAGFSCNSTDKNGRTPLHLCCLNTSVESALCATFLAIRFKQALTIFDNEGCNPLQTAVMYNNTQTVKALINNVSSESALNSMIKSTSKDKTRGKSAYDLAIELGLNDIINIIESKLNIPSRFHKNNYSRKETKVDQERIMKIWEKFFENAFARFENESQSDNVSIKDNCSGRKNNNNMDRKSIQYDYKNDYIPRVNTKHQQKKYNKDISHTLSIVDILHWFNWIMMYDSNVDNIQLGYYLINKKTKETMWLNDFLKMQSRFLKSINFSFIYNNNWEDDAELIEALMSKPYPSNIREAICDGWITYYDNFENCCYWISIPTKCTEYYLPLGVREDKLLLSQLQLAPFIDDDNWYEADKYASKCWIMVFSVTNDISSFNNNNYIDDINSGINVNSNYYNNSLIKEKRIDQNNKSDSKDDNKSNNQTWNMWDSDDINVKKEINDNKSNNMSSQKVYCTYYYNRLTSESTWQKPKNWDELIVEWDNWMLCCNEERIKELYW